MKTFTQVRKVMEQAKNGTPREKMAADQAYVLISTWSLPKILEALDLAVDTLEFVYSLEDQLSCGHLRHVSGRLKAIQELGKS